MNIDIRAAFINGLLAAAAYVGGLTQGATGLTLTNLLSTPLTEPRAKYVGDHFQIVTQYTESNVTASDQRRIKGVRHAFLGT